jgi:hypothetical protein
MDDPSKEVRQHDDQQGLPQHCDEFVHTTEWLTQINARALIDKSAEPSVESM